MADRDALTVFPVSDERLEHLENVAHRCLESGYRYISDSVTAAELYAMALELRFLRAEITEALAKARG